MVKKLFISGFHLNASGLAFKTERMAVHEEKQK